jgi:uncharacterized protein (TIGR02246 family)
MNALRESDMQAISALMADDVLHTDPSGAVHGKQQVLAGLEIGSSFSTEVEVDEVEVRVYGPTAVATGRTIIQAGDGAQKVRGAFRFTDVFVKFDDGWKIVASHTTLIASGSADVASGDESP